MTKHHVFIKRFENIETEITDNKILKQNTKDMNNIN